MIKTAIVVDFTAEFLHPFIGWQMDQMFSIYDSLKQSGFTFAVVTHEGQVSIARTVGDPDSSTFAIEGDPTLTTGYVEDPAMLSHVSMGMLSDPESEMTSKIILTHLSETVQAGEFIYVVKTPATWTVTVLTPDNPAIYSASIEYIPMQDRRLIESHAPGAERFLIENSQILNK